MQRLVSSNHDQHACTHAHLLALESGEHSRCLGDTQVLVVGSGAAVVAVEGVVAAVEARPRRRQCCAPQPPLA
jgi:hypothetical protein